MSKIYPIYGETRTFYDVGVMKVEIRADMNELSGSLTDVISKLQRTLKDIPAEFRNTAKVSFNYNWSDEDVSYKNFTVAYSRPLTEEEKANRLAEQQARDEGNRKRDLEALRVLQEKYGKNA